MNLSDLTLANVSSLANLGVPFVVSIILIGPQLFA